MKRRLSSHAVLLALVVPALGAACSAYDRDLPPVPKTIEAATPPPAISGGTLVVSRDGTRAVASDPDRDRVFAVDLDRLALVAEIPLERGDEPGRVVEDQAGRFHVALRAGGGVATIDLATAQVVRRAAVCAAPRGLAYDSATDTVHVACSGGELVSLAAATGAETRRLELEHDLRDIVVDGDALLVSTFRTARVLRVDGTGNVSQQLAPAPANADADFMTGEPRVFEPDVAWRMVPAQVPVYGQPTVAIMVHQRALAGTIHLKKPEQQAQTEPAYGSASPSSVGPTCVNSIVHGTVSLFHRSGDVGDNVYAGNINGAIGRAVLPVDIAVDEGGDLAAVVGAGTKDVTFLSLSGLSSMPVDDSCSTQGTAVEGGPIAVARWQAGHSWIVQTREPAGIVVMSDTVTVAKTLVVEGESVADTGHEMFHTNDGGMLALACASCHAEGRDDGRVWRFDPIGPRRTPTLGGGIMGTLPLHWDGDMSDLGLLMDEVFTRRMGGLKQSPRRVRAFGQWLDQLPAFRPNPVNVDAVARGRALFESKPVGCADCHSGPALTNNDTVDVGTGKAFQVPPLVGLGARAPFMHDGCAPTLRDRFSQSTECGGSDHGHTSQLSAAELDDLVAYLESL